jgi:hypothetical protein
MSNVSVDIFDDPNPEKLAPTKKAINDNYAALGEALSAELGGKADTIVMRVQYSGMY